ncbi:hypothetical protein EVG20_g1502 [Dentipellis fragilis]|uniref:DUF6533 domain-containing protein n=1 Tax=Dentipellis fragilis TaxID=205917 RepID=A0A4Y9ZCI0_9AGAM|nr:hypothetical protein EVG20_g1502 [Dentipellis fragilis]
MSTDQYGPIGGGHNRNRTGADESRVVLRFRGIHLAAANPQIYDYLLTLPDEVALIWGSHWTVTKAIFFLNRYIPFANIGIGIYSDFGYNTSNATCHALYSTIAWMIICGVAVTMTIFILRTWAIWGKNQIIGYGLGILLLMACIAMSVLVQRILRSVEFTPVVPISPNLRGCFITKADTLQYICYAITLAYESVIIVLTLIKGWQHLRTSNSRLVVLLYRDGILAYLLIFASSIANVLVLLLGPLEYADLLILTQRVIHVILTNRIFLNIRRSALARRLVMTRPEVIELEDIRST